MPQKMPPASKKAAPVSRSTRKAAPKQVSTLRVSARARTIIAFLLQEMREGMQDPGRIGKEDWERLFGSKQSMVVNLQKLVQALAALPDGACEVKPRGKKDEEASPISMNSEEIAMLKAWLEEGK